MRRVVCVLCVLLLWAALARAEEMTVVDNEYYRATILDCLWDEDEEGLFFLVRHENKTGETLTLRGHDLYVDEVCAGPGKRYRVTLDAGETKEQYHGISLWALRAVQMEDVTNISLTLTGQNEAEEELFRERVTAPAPLPEGILPPVTPPIALAEWNGLELALLYLEPRGVPGFMNLDAVMRMTSLRDTPVTVEASAMWLNGVGKATAMGLAAGRPFGDEGVTLPPGERTAVTVAIDAEYVRAPVREITLRLYEIDEERGLGYPGTDTVTFELPEPYILSEE